MPKPALNWIAANNIDKPVGSLTYTQMLDDKGGIQCDLTIARIAEDEFYIVTGTGFVTHDFNWIKSNIGPEMNANLHDITSTNAVLSLMGPEARNILQKVTDDDISNEKFKFGTMKHLKIAGLDAMALRVTYVGELGWELHFATENAVQIYDALMRAGTSHGLINAGYRTIESCRLEKGYRAWGSDIGPDHTPLEAGLGWAVKLKTNIPFKGREAISRQHNDGLKKMLVCFSLDDRDAILLGRETIYRNGERVGWLTSGGYGHTVGKAIGFGYLRNPDGVDKSYALQGDYALEIATKLTPCNIHLEPLYDPQMLRIKK